MPGQLPPGTGQARMGLIAFLLIAFLLAGLRLPVESEQGRSARTVLAVVVPVFVAMFVLVLRWETSG